MSSNKDDTKSLQVVFERRNLSDSINNDFDYVRRPKLDLKSKEAMKYDVKKEVQKFDVIKRDGSKRHEQIGATITTLIEAIKDANIQEDAATDKFVDNVECMVSRFNNDLDKLQKIFSNVLQKLPKVEG